MDDKGMGRQSEDGLHGVRLRRRSSVDPVTTPADLALALELADAADEVTLRYFRQPDLQVESKPDTTPVTEGDRATEQLLRSLLAERRPDDAIVGEEYGGSEVTGRRWIIDPIDGTKNYLRGVPVWATLIALVDGDEVVVGVVSAPALGRRWWAGRGEGSWTRGPEDSHPRRNRVSSIDQLADASFSFSDQVDWPTGGLSRTMAATWRSRAYGDFWSHMMVAEGVVDIAAEPVLSIWDVAALVPVVQEAGGQMTAFDGTDLLTGMGALTTNGVLHEAALRTIHG